MLRLHERLPEWILKRQALWAVLIIFAFIAWKAMGIAHAAECPYDLLPNKDKPVLVSDMGIRMEPATPQEVQRSLGVIPCSLEGTTPINPMQHSVQVYDEAWIIRTGYAMYPNPEQAHNREKFIIDGRAARMTAFAVFPDNASRRDKFILDVLSANTDYALRFDATLKTIHERR
jgi:hypothetical protein